MNQQTDHKPEPWYQEAGSDDCPHGPEPEDDNSPEWEAWDEQTSDRHTGSPQDVRICLDAPMGDCCAACSEENGEAVRWADCRERARTRPRPESGEPQHRAVTVEGGDLECLERECDEYFTDEGDEIPGKESCSHIHEMEICEACSELPTSGEFSTVVAWTDCKQRSAAPASAVAVSGGEQL